MNRVFIAFMVFILLGCNNSNPPSTNSMLWEFHAKNNQIAFDNACQPLLINYQEILKGVQAKDTAFLFNAAKNLSTLMDSFPVFTSSKDSALNDHIKHGLTNIQSEIQGLMAETSWFEMYKAANMISIQMIHLLGEAGYGKNNIYIFHTSFEQQEDGFYWFGINKTARDPYHPEQKELVEAPSILQEP
jgi:hypothetical protein